MKLALALLATTRAAALEYCAGEYSLCDDGSCALVNASCGVCAEGEYVCPLSSTCLAAIEDYDSCPGLANTHFDTSLSEDDRLAYLIDTVSTADMIAQLVNDAPAISDVALPAYNWLNDNEHGVKGTANATVYPMGVGLGATFDVDVVREVGAAIGAESRATHNAQADKSGNSCGSTSTGEVVANGCGITLYAPNINLVRDPRWGRAEEVYGEDPHLTAELAVAVITGMQGNAEGESTAPDGGALLSGACCKHYAVYQNEDVPEERTVLDANVTARDLWETYMPVMKACVKRAKATHVMCSYNAVNGKPVCAHDELLNDVLRASWGFEGFVVSDYDAWVNLKTTHHYVETFAEAAAAGLNAGMDQEGGFGDYYPINNMADALAAGNVTEDGIARAFTRLMRVRLRLGMFDPPASTPVYDASVYAPEKQCETDERLELARRAARDGIVLLKNDDAALPLAAADFTAAGSLALIGPQANDWRVLLGAVNYAFADGPSRGVQTIYKGIAAALGGVGNGTADSPLVHVDGCANVSCFDADVDAAAAAAGAAKATVVVLGDWFGASTGWPLCTEDGDGCESEAHDRVAIELPGRQVELAQALKAASGGPLVCVLVHGGAVALGGAKAACDAIVDLWVPGQMGGAALADVLFGASSPAGRSPITFYAATADLPPMGVFDEYAREGTSNGTTYRYYVGAAPEFRFGDGLSYTTFAYSALSAPASAAPCDAITINVTLTNTGATVSDEVVQVYASTPSSSVPSPNTRLVAFARARAVAPGASVALSLRVAPDAHAVVYPQSSVYVEQLAVEQGPLVLHVGGAQPGGEPDATLAATVQIAETALLDACA